MPIHLNPTRHHRNRARSTAPSRTHRQCWGNALAESFFATIKSELLDRQPWPTHNSARAAIFDYIESWYDTTRRHSALGYLSPTTYENTATTPAA